MKAEDWNDAVLTKRMTVAEMIALMAEIVIEDSTAFMAAVRED